MAERFMTQAELAEELHIAIPTVLWRLKEFGIKPSGKQNGVKVYWIDPETFIPKRERLRREGWLPTSEICEIVGKSQWVVPFLREVGAKRDARIRNVTFWLLPEHLKDRETLYKTYQEWMRRKMAAKAAWKERIDKPAEEDDGDWLSSVPNGPVKDLVLRERADRGLIGKEIEVETSGGRRVRGTLLECSMNSMTMRVGGVVRFWPRREVTIINQQEKGKDENEENDL